MGKYKYQYNSWVQQHGVPGSQDPNNPNPGQFNKPNSQPDFGGGQGGQSKPVTVPSGDDYHGWNWEQTLTGVLGLALPTRADVTAQEWIAINFNSSGGTGMYRIFAASWKGGGSGGPHHDTFVYLNPNLLEPGGIWDNYFFQPLNALNNAAGGNYTALQVNPRTFGSVAAAVNSVMNFYDTTNNTFQGLYNAVSGDKSAFKGKAGEAFAELINNLYQLSNSAYKAMSNPNYADLISTAGSDVRTFFTSLSNAISNWSQMLDHSPLGAIYQALLDGGVITGSGNSFQMANPISTDSSFGDLTYAAAWQAIEAAAKQLWTTSVSTALDPVAQSAINALVTGYQTVTSDDQPLPAPTIHQISAGNAMSDAMNNFGGDLGNALNHFGGDLGNALNGLGGDMGNALNGMGGDLGNALNHFGGDMGNALNGLGGSMGNALNNFGGAMNNANPGGANPNTSLNGPGGIPNTSLNAPGGANPNTSFNGPNGLNTPGNLNTPNNLSTALGNGPLGGAGNPNIANGLNTPGSLNVPSSLNAPGSVLTGLGNPGTNLPGGLNSPQLGALQTALGDNGATQKALQGALTLAPPTGPLHNALITALANNGKAGAALRSALNGSMTPAAALQTALADNGQTQAALRQALALAPARGPLHNALQTALNDANKTQRALNHALASGSIPNSGPIHQALHSDAALNRELHKALLSSQVPSHGPLHDALTNAIAQSGHVKSALDQALAGGASNTSALNHALSSNAALQADLRKALSQAPPTGPLHNELMAALADSKNVGTQIHQALAQAGAPTEPLPGLLSAGVANPAAGLGPLSQLGQHGLTATLGAPQTLTATPGLGGGAAGAGLAGAAAPISSGRFVAQPAAGTASAPANGTSAVPFFPPMAGGMGMGGMGGQQEDKERERTTWLSEDEKVWGTEPALGPAVLGRDLPDDEEDFDSYDEFDKPTQPPARDRAPTSGREL